MFVGIECIDLTGGILLVDCPNLVNNVRLLVVVFDDRLNVQIVFVCQGSETNLDVSAIDRVGDNKVNTFIVKVCEQLNLISNSSN